MVWPEKKAQTCAQQPLHCPSALAEALQARALHELLV